MLRNKYVGRCPECDTEQPVSDWLEEVKPGQSGGRVMLVHGAFQDRCKGSGERVYGWWLPGDMKNGFTAPKESSSDFFVI